MRSRWVAAFASVLVVSALASCGAASESPEASGEPVVRIGVISPQDAGLTDFGLGILHSVELAVEQANASGAVPGWTIEVLPLDDSSEPAKGVAAAATMIADDSVVGIVGPYNSGVALAMLPDLSVAGLALVSPANTLTSLTLGDDLASPVRPYPNYFRLVGADDKQGAFLAEQALASGASTVAVVSETKAVSKGLADIFAAAFESDGGTVAVREVVPDGATDFADFIDAATDADPDLIFFGGEYPVAATLRVQANAAGLTVPIMGGDGIQDPAYVEAAGAADAEGTLASTVGVPLDALASAAPFLEDYAAAGYADPPSAYGPYAYDAANTIIAALPRVLEGVSRPLDARAALVAALATTSLSGASGEVAFDDFGDTRYPVFTLYRVAGGAWVAES